MHLTVGIYGSLEFFSEFGKVGTENDIAMRHQSEAGNVITYVSSKSDKIQPLIQAAAMADFHILVIDEITPSVGEIILLLDAMKASNGIIATNLPEEAFNAIIKDTVLKNFEIVAKDAKDVREKILSTKIERSGAPLIVTIDNYFTVKSVGTVALGMVKSGQVKQYDKLLVQPLGKEAIVKSMQSQDKDIKETEPGQRIGAALKGVEAEELKRGHIMSDAEVKCTDKLLLEVAKNRYSKFDFVPGRKLMLAIGLQVISADVTKVSGKSIEVKLDSNAAVYENRCILATSDSAPRIIGSAIITKTNL